MDFHAIAEACRRGVVRPRRHRPRPRESMVRIATGQDTSDTAFMTVTRGLVALNDVQVTAVLGP